MARASVPEPLIEAFGEPHAVMASGQRAPVTAHVTRILGRPPRSFQQFAAAYAARRSSSVVFSAP
jgi:hypothetical protein